MKPHFTFLFKSVLLWDMGRVSGTGSWLLCSVNMTNVSWKEEETTHLLSARLTHASAFENTKSLKLQLVFKEISISFRNL